MTTKTLSPLRMENVTLLKVGGFCGLADDIRGEYLENTVFPHIVSSLE